MMRKPLEDSCHSLESPFSFFGLMALLHFRPEFRHNGCSSSSPPGLWGGLDSGNYLLDGGMGR